MNMKPGQLGRIISVEETERLGTVDKIVRVTTIRGTTPDGSPSWNYEGPALKVNVSGIQISICGISDDILRPINDPGDNDVDEMVRLVGPAPGVKAEVTA